LICVDLLPPLKGLRDRHNRQNRSTQRSTQIDARRTPASHLA
jgi:hypothetical protein